VTASVARSASSAIPGSLGVPSKSGDHQRAAEALGREV
jgi:hypothetical protein